MSNRIVQIVTNPTSISILVSIGLHGAFGISVPVFSTAGNGQDFSKHSVGLIKLSPTEENRLPLTNNSLNTLPSIPTAPTNGNISNFNLPNSNNLTPLPNTNNSNTQTIPVFPNQPGVSLPFNPPPSPIGIVPLPDDSIPILNQPKVIANNKTQKSTTKIRRKPSFIEQPNISYNTLPPPPNFPKQVPVFDDYQPGFSNNPNIPDNINNQQITPPPKQVITPKNKLAFNQTKPDKKDSQPEFNDSPSTPLEKPTQSTVVTPQIPPKDQKKVVTNNPEQPGTKPNPKTPNRVVTTIEINPDGTVVTKRNTPNNNQGIPLGVQPNATIPNNNDDKNNQKLAVNSSNSSNNGEDIKLDKTGTTDEEARKKYLEQLIKLQQKPTKEKDSFISSVYPEKACSEKLEGVASIAVIVNAQGQVIGEPELVKSSGYKLLNREAINQVKKRNFANKTGGEKSYLVDVKFNYNEKKCNQSKGIS